MKFLTATVTLLLTLALSSCADAPSHLILAPELNLPTVNKYHNKTAQLNVTDLRIAKHIIQVLRKSEAAELMTSQQTLSEIIQQTLNKEFKKQGLNLAQPSTNQVNNDQSVNNIEVIIDKALISVKQETMSYEAKSNISLRIKVKNAQQTLTKTFNSRNTSTGSLTADVAVLERDFNQQLSTALVSILTNDEITQFIK